MTIESIMILNFNLVYDEISTTSIEHALRTIPRTVCLFENFQRQKLRTNIFRLFQRSNEAIRAELARCIGTVGYIMLNENEPKSLQTFVYQKTQKF